MRDIGNPGRWLCFMVCTPSGCSWRPTASAGRMGWDMAVARAWHAKGPGIHLPNTLVEEEQWWGLLFFKEEHATLLFGWPCERSCEGSEG